MMDTPDQPPAPAPPSQPSPPELAEPSSWPTVFGVIGIIIASLGILGGCCGVAMPFAWAPFITMMENSGNVPAEDIDRMRNSVPPAAWMFAAGAVGLILASMLLTGSIGMLRRRESGYKLCRLWCWIIILWAAISIPVNFLLTPRPPTGSQPGGQAGQLVGSAFGICLGVLLWIAFPIFMLVWFSRASVKHEVAGWEAEHRERI